MSRPREVIDSYMEEVLFKLVSQSIRNMPAEDAADAAKKLRAFEDFNRDSAACKKRITIDSMSALLRIANVTVVDLCQLAQRRIQRVLQATLKTHSVREDANPSHH